MFNYEKFVERVIFLAEQGRREEEIEIDCRGLIAELKMSHKDINERECRDISNSKLKTLISKTISLNSNGLFGLLKDVFQLLYLKESPMLRIVYQFVPLLLRSLFEPKEFKNQGLEKIINVIQANEMTSYNRYVKERQHIRSSPFVRDLYVMHFGGRVEEEGENDKMEKYIEREENGRGQVQVDRQLTKMVMLFVVYKNIQQLSDEALREYLKTVFIICGGQTEDYNNVSSFYLLEKKNLFNCFRFSISEQEIEWILMTLYELSMSSQKERYQLLAAINMIYKKTANESMFRYSQIAQSIIHLLEDEYIDIFS